MTTNQSKQTFLLKMGIKLLSTYKSNGGLSLSQMDDVKLITDNLLPTTKQKHSLITDLTNIYLSN
jgi:hypothetical protein